MRFGVIFADYEAYFFVNRKIFRIFAVTFFIEYEL